MNGSLKRDEYIERILGEFVFLDSPLGSHPKMTASLRTVDGDTLYTIARTPKDLAQRSYERFSTGHSVADLVLRTHDCVIVDDANASSILYPPFEAQDYKSLLSAPLLDGGKVVAVLSLSSGEVGYFRNEHLGLAQLLSAILAYLLRPSKLVTPASISLGRALADIRRELGFTQTGLADLMNRGRITLSRWESGAQPPSPGVLYEWCQALGLFSDAERAIFKSVDITSRLPSLLEVDSQTLAELSPSQFELFIAGRLDRMGFEVTLTGPTSYKDGGIDLIAIPKIRTVGSFLLAGQVKHHSGRQKTGRAAVDRLLAWKDGGFNMGLLVTNTSFTKDAKWIADQGSNQAFIRLRDLDDIKRWINDNFSSPEDWREIPDKIELAPGVIIEIPKPKLSNSLDIWPLSKIKYQ